jgi:hypothetical protein
MSTIPTYGGAITRVFVNLVAGASMNSRALASIHVFASKTP